MAKKTFPHNRKQAGYLAAYFGLLLFSISSLVTQGGPWILVGTVCWSGAALAFFILRSKRTSTRYSMT